MLATVRLSAAARSFGTAREGSVAILFALMAVPFFGIASGAIDYGRALRVETILQGAAESAAAAAAQELGNPNAALSQIMRAHLDANLPEGMQGIEFTYDVEPERKAVQVEIRSSVPTFLASIVGIEDFKVRANARAALPTVTLASRPGGPAASGAAGTAMPEVSRKTVDAIEQLGASARAAGGVAKIDPVALEAQMRRLIEAHGASGGMQAPRPEDLARLRAVLGR